MTPTPLPLTRELVLIGGGHSHALVLRRWGMDPLPGARLTVINPGPTAPYTGMLPGHVAGHYDRATLDIDLVPLARFADARLILGKVDGIDTANRRIRIAGRGDIGFDVASIDVGITAAMPDLPGFSEHAVPVKPLGPFADRWEAYLNEEGPASVAMIGGGVAGCEVALAMAHALRTKHRDGTIHVIERGRALSELGLKTRDVILRKMDEAGIVLKEHCAIACVDADQIHLDDGSVVSATFVAGAAGARPWPWLANTGLETQSGYLTVNAHLQTSDPSVFASGDCAHLGFAPRPKAGVYAVRAAPVLTRNLRAALSGGVLRAFRPQNDYLKLVSLGRQAAVGEKWGFALRGDWVWRWKDRIDRRFMNRLTDLPAMALPPAPAEAALGLRDAVGAQPPCAGCGAKVGPDTLAGVLAEMRPPKRPDVLIPPGDDAAILTVNQARQVISTDHLRSVTNDPFVMAQIAAEHAMGDVWAMGARPQAALATIILPRLSEALQRDWLTEIMAGALRSLDAAGSALAGGHTTLGSELTIGFTVTGLLSGDPIGLSGAIPNDALILTRPIGSGTLFAAEMAGKAHGEDLAALFAELTKSQAAAAQVLAPHAHAMTDVTGFGLMGHLGGILRASGCAAELVLNNLPLFPGALDLSGHGIRSTLYPANRAASLPLIGPDEPRADLLFDPQTAGGLLASVPQHRADHLVVALREAGYTAARIGTIIEGPPTVTLI